MNFLKGNFRVKKEVVRDPKVETKDAGRRVAEDLRRSALASIGGSMVYVDRETLSWDGEDDDR